MPRGDKKGDFLYGFDGGCSHHRLYKHLHAPIKPKRFDKDQFSETLSDRLKINKIPGIIEEGRALINQFTKGFELTLIGMSISMYHKILTGVAAKQDLESSAIKLLEKLESSNVNVPLDTAIKELCNILPKFVLKTTLQLAAIELYDQISKLGIRPLTEEELEAEEEAKAEAEAEAEEEALSSDLGSLDWVLLSANDFDVDMVVDGNALAMAGLVGDADV